MSALNGTVIHVEEDIVRTNEFTGQRHVLPGRVTIRLENDENVVLFRHTGQVDHDIKVGDRGIYRWLNTSSACYPIFKRNS